MIKLDTAVYDIVFIHIYYTFCPTLLRTIPSDTFQEMDSRTISYSITVDRVKLWAEEFDTSAPECEVDHTIMNKKRMEIKFEHNTKTISLRDMKFHSEEVVTTVSLQIY